MKMTPEQINRMKRVGEHMKSFVAPEREEAPAPIPQPEIKEQVFIPKKKPVVDVVFEDPAEEQEAPMHPDVFKNALTINPSTKKYFESVQENLDTLVESIKARRKK